MTGDSMMYLLTSITPAIFNSLMTNCFQAIQMLDDSNASQACSIVNKIFSDSIEHNGKFFNIDGNVHHEKFLQLITTRIFTESLESQWSFTRPMLPLILYQGDWFVQYMNILIQGNEKLQEVVIIKIGNEWTIGRYR